jgi:hypothetical protein
MPVNGSCSAHHQRWLPGTTSYSAHSLVGGAGRISWVAQTAGAAQVWHGQIARGVLMWLP